MKPFTYEKLMQQEGISLEDLSIDAQTAIKKLKKTLNGIKLTEGQGRKVSQSILNEVEMLDKLATREILEQIDASGKGKNPDDAAAKKAADDAAAKKAQDDAAAEKKKQDDAAAAKKAQEDEDEKKRQESIEGAVDKKHAAVNKELRDLIASGKQTVSLDELKSSAPVSYGIIFENYKDSEENGIEIPPYSCMETKPGSGQFTLSKT